MFLHGLFRLLITTGILTLAGLGIYDYLNNFDENECSMTYMKQNPGILPVDLPQTIKSQFPNYKLYYYCEGYDCQKYEKLKFTEPNHIPVLFIPGNADSHMQVRSMASVGLDKSRKQKYSKIKFHYFTISFNEELTALYGPLLDIQTKYVKHCIKHVLKLFNAVQPSEKRPKSVVLIGNSMGGIIARGIFLSPIDSHLVHTIITKSTPHIRPVISIDNQLSNYYDKVNNLWLNQSSRLDNVVLASLYGGTRDILVRSGLANLNDWKSKSPAGIISSYTVSMPHVWRNIDHRCMAWCRELVMNLNRALFNLIDPHTGQIIENRKERERILRFHLERDIHQSLIENIELKNAKQIENYINFDFNDYNQEESTFMFDLKNLNKSQHDSLFIYTNINAKMSFLLCKTSNCSSSDYKDLMSQYGRSIPPYIESVQKEQSLKTINIINIDKVIENENFEYLVIRVPINSNASPFRHQTIIKFDWYLIKKRLYFLNLPTIQNMNDYSINKFIDYSSITSKIVFKRVYLPTFLSVLQAFNLKKLYNPNSCDKILIKKSTSNTRIGKPLSVSTLMLQFNEPTSATVLLSDHVYHSQSIQTKSKNLTMMLTKNSDYEQKNFPYIDLIQFEMKHLINKNDPSSVENAKCSTEHHLEIEMNLFASLGQFIRFYSVFVPAFLVALLQFYDYINLTKSHDENRENKASFFILNSMLTKFKKNFQLSIIINLVIYIIIQFGYLIQPFQLETDFEQLNQEHIWFTYLPFLLFWCAYAILSTACFFLSVIFKFYSYILQSVFGFSVNYSYLKSALFLMHVILTISSGIFVSTLTHINIFYAILIKLCLAKFSNDELDKKWTNLFFHYLILVLNLAPLLVWVKSLNNINNGEIRPLDFISSDNGYLIALLNLIIYLVYFLKEKSHYIQHKKLFNWNNRLLANLVFLNLLISILYSTLNLYRLQYFLLAHLVLMFFASAQSASTNQPFSKSKYE